MDSVVDLLNVASLTFKDNEAAFLAGVAAAKTTKDQNKLVLSVGSKVSLLTVLRAGFVEGVKQLILLSKLKFNTPRFIC